MAQLTIYLDEPTMAKVAKAAKRSRCSVSKWVRSQLEHSLESAWPPAFVSVLGSLADSDLERPAQQSQALDTKREML